MDSYVVYGGGDGVPFGEDGGVGGGFCVLELRGCNHRSVLDDERQHLSSFGILRGVRAQIDEGVDCGGKLGLEEDAVAAPHLAQGESAEFEVGHEAEVVSAASEGPEEVGVGCWGCGEDAAGGSD